eukprot:15478387-Alexandrium_andersonii.AAC.1
MCACAHVHVHLPLERVRGFQERERERERKRVTPRSYLGARLGGQPTGTIERARKLRGLTGATVHARVHSTNGVGRQWLSREKGTDLRATAPGRPGP